MTIDLETEHAQSGPTGKLQQQLEWLSQLPRSQQRLASQMLVTVLREPSGRTA